MDFGTLGAVSLQGATNSATPSPEQAAREFEAMLIAQFVKTARETVQAKANEDSMTGADSYLEFAEKYLAEALAAGGTFGFGRMILRELRGGPPPSAGERAEETA